MRYFLYGPLSDIFLYGPLWDIFLYGPSWDIFCIALYEIYFVCISASPIVGHVGAGRGHSGGPLGGGVELWQVEAPRHSHGHLPAHHHWRRWLFALIRTNTFLYSSLNNVQC